LPLNRTKTKQLRVFVKCLKW